jgi:serine/threonine-protein kinase HipA
MIRAGGASLAPMYDLMCGDVWENVTKNLAQKIAGESHGDHLKRTHWQRFARECGLNPSQVVDRVKLLAKSAITEAETAASEVAAMPAGHHVILDQARHAIERRAHALLAQLQELGGKSAITEEAGPAEEEAEVRELAAR